MDERHLHVLSRLIRPTVHLLGLLLFATATAPAFAAGGAKNPAPPDRPSLGAADAPVTVLVVRSFRCDHCRTFQEETFPALRRDFVDTGRVRWTVLDADDSDPRATIFEVARAAHAAGVYWEINDFLFTLARRSPSAILGAVEQGDLPGRGPMLAALRDGSARAAAAADLAAARDLGIKHLPTFILTGPGPDGATREERLEGRVEEATLLATLGALLSASR